MPLHAAVSETLLYRCSFSDLLPSPKPSAGASAAAGVKGKGHKGAAAAAPPQQQQQQQRRGWSCILLPSHFKVCGTPLAQSVETPSAELGLYCRARSA